MKKNVALMALTGILTLASCSQGDTPDTTDKTAPTVSLSADPTSLTKEGGTTTLTASASDNVAVTKVEFYRDGNLINTDTAAPFTYVDTLAANATTAVKSYSYTAKAFDSVQSTTSNAVQVTVAGTTTGTPNPTGAAIAITSPTTGASFRVGETVRVTFNRTGTVTDITCKVGDGTAVTANVATSTGFCDVAVTTAGATNITVTGKDSTGATVSNSISVSATAPAANPIGFSSDQYLNPSDRNLVGEDVVNGKYTNQESGWRVLGQVVTTPTNPDPTQDVYVKGKNLNVTFTVPGGATGSIEAFYTRTTGTNVPTNDSIQAADKIGYVANGTSLTVKVDTTRFSEFEGVRQWIVFRVNGTTIYTQPVVTDNTAPQAAQPQFERANNANSNVITLPSDSSIRAARGQIEIYTTNRSLQDQPFGQAPAGSPFAQRRPAGLESITYYVIPEATARTLTDADATRRAADIQNLGTAMTATTPRFATSEGGADTSDYRATFDSTKVADGTYRIYAITRDLVGNQVASSTFQRVFFDNTGPSAAGVTLCDASPLPFISTEPCRYISDVAVLNIGGFADAGVGLDTGTYNVNLGGFPLIYNGVFSNVLTDIGGGLYFIDTNKLADGEQAFNFNGVTDYLGNPISAEELARLNANKITIDNTDPTLEINRPNGSQFRSGEEISVDIKATDRTSGVYQNLAFWDDSFIGGGDVATLVSANQVMHPVELGRVTAPTPTTFLAEVTNNPRMTAPYVVGGPRIQQYMTTAIATDKAGNATMRTVPVNILNKYDNAGVTGTLAVPQLGRYDGHRQSEVAAFTGAVNKTFTIDPFGANSTQITRPATLFNANRDNLSLLENGTRALSVMNGTTGSETIKTVNNFGAFAANDWATIQGYLLGTGFGAADAEARATAQRDAAVNRLRDAALLAARDRTLTTEERAQLIALGARGSTLTAVTLDGRFTYSADTPQDTDDVATVVNDAKTNVFDPILEVTLDNLDKFYSDPSLARGATGTALRQDRIYTQNWGETTAPWLKLGDTATPAQGKYVFTTNGLNNLYWNMQDDRASSYPSSTYSFVPEFFSVMGLRATYDALAGIVMDSAGAYNYYGEFYNP